MWICSGRGEFRDGTEGSACKRVVRSTSWRRSCRAQKGFRSGRRCAEPTFYDGVGREWNARGGVTEQQRGCRLLEQNWRYRKLRRPRVIKCRSGAPATVTSRNVELSVGGSRTGPMAGGEDLGGLGSSRDKPHQPTAQDSGVMRRE